MQDLQPKLEEIKRQFPNDKQAQSTATMALYKNNKVNPFTSCLPMLVQLPILIALYLVLRDGLASSNLAQNLYPFVHNPEKISAVSLGIFNLAEHNFVLAVLAGAAQFWQAKMLTRKTPPKNAGPGAKDEGLAAMMNKQMLYFMPLMTVIIGMRLPGGLTLYWFLSTALMGLQQFILFRKLPPTPTPTSTTPNVPPVVEGEVVKK